MADPERDERVSASYRALGREEPSAALDAAILAAARRRGSRWGVPVSIAAVLVLAAGVTLRMQQEQPNPELAVPAPQAMEERRPAPPARENAPHAAADAVALGRSRSEVAAKPAGEAPARAAAPRVADVASAPASAPAAPQNRPKRRSRPSPGSTASPLCARRGA